MNEKEAKKKKNVEVYCNLKVYKVKLTLSEEDKS